MACRLFAKEFSARNSQHRKHLGILKMSSCLMSGALAFASTPAYASSLFLSVPASTVSVIFAVPVASGCFQYVYDPNGNRLSSSVTAITSTNATWGSATFGCAVWGQ